MYQWHEVSAFFNCVRRDNQLWYYDYYNDSINILDLRTGRNYIETFLPIDEDGCYVYMRYGHIAWYNNTIILMPRGEKNILLYNVSNKSFRKISLELTDWKGRDYYNLFNGIRVVNDKAYLMAGRYPAIVKLNLTTWKVSYLREWYCEIENEALKDNLVIFSVTYDKEGQIYLPFWQGNKVFCFSADNEKGKWITLSTSDIEIGAVCITHDIMWASDKNHPRVVKYNLQTHEEEIIDISGNLLHTDKGIAGLAEWNGKIYALPMPGDSIIRIDARTGNCEAVCSFDTANKMNFHIGDSNFICIRQVENMLYLYSNWDAEVILMDLSTGDMKKYSAALTDKSDVRKAKIHEAKLRRDILGESADWSLAEFLTMVMGN